MIALSPDETELIEQLLDCVARGASQIEDVNLQYANRTKLQKLLYFAIDEFDLPITYSWYLAGSVVESDTVGPATLQTAGDDLPASDSPSIESDTDAASSELDTDDPDESVLSEAETVPPVLFDDGFETAAKDTGVSPDLSSYVEPSEVIDFYANVIPDVWFQPTMRFLQNFYVDHAPEQYRDLYVTSVQLRANLSEFETALEAARTGDDHSRSLDDLLRSIELQVSDLHLELADVETLSDTFDAVVASTDALEHALVVLADLEPSELTENHIDFVDQLADFFYYGIWRYPCLIISRDTARGPSADAIVERRTEQLQTFEADLTRRRDRIQQQLEKLVSADGRRLEPLPMDEAGEPLISLTEEYFDR